MHRLEIDLVSKTYRGGIRAVHEIALDLRPGIVGLLGPNGAGKSTLMRIVATVAKPTSGTVRWDGDDVVRAPQALRRVLGYLPQDAGVYPHLDAYEFLDYIAALKEIDARSARRQRTRSRAGRKTAARHALRRQPAARRNRPGVARRSATPRRR